ncbi:hypothetical protein [Roseospira goensis]|uniref:Flagellar protein FliL n=1 Tax=Roseospira goensis TaxID=391922 RepID=A0A7W6RXT1_9PROT|nr:hypothetical protein [Roseospira goensis]MBB4285041.1 hypothetical protein [Roseospira goensis]
MKRLLVLVVLLLLLVAGAGGLTAMGVVPDVLGVRPMLASLLGLPAEPDEAAVAAPPPPDYGPEPVFMRLPQLAVPVIADGVSRTHLLLSLRLHVDPEARADVTRAIPRLTDAFLTGLLTELPDIRDRTGRLDLVSVKAVLNALSAAVVGSDKVHDVLIDGAYAR